MNVKWLVDEYLDEDRRLPTGQMPLVAACEAFGIESASVKFTPGKDNSNIFDVIQRWDEDACVVIHGSYQFVRHIQNLRPNWVPGAYCRRETHSYQAFSARFGEHLLNDEFVLLPYSEFVRRKATWFKDIDAVFVKPDAVTKAFAGKVIWEDDFDHEINCMNQIERPHPDLLCVVARPKKIEGEFRFVIAGDEVVTGSEYRWDGRLDVRTDIHPKAMEMAGMVAKSPWRPDQVFVVDIALHEGEPKIIEFNTFACSGLYACDTAKIVESISREAWSEYEARSL